MAAAAVPSGAILIIVPILAAFNIPESSVGLLWTVDFIM